MSEIFLKLEIENLKPETKEQMIVTNATWIRLRRLEQEYAQTAVRRDEIFKEIKVAKEDHEIQQGKLSKLLLDEPMK